MIFFTAVIAIFLIVGAYIFLNLLLNLLRKREIERSCQEFVNSFMKYLMELKCGKRKYIYRQWAELIEGQSIK